LIEKRQHIIRFIDKAKELYYSENQLDSP